MEAPANTTASDRPASTGSPASPPHRVELAQGTIRYRDSGSGPVLLFVHGLLVNGSLWRKVTPLLEDRFRCVVPDWPLGAHSPGMRPTADITPRGVARIVDDFMAALDLHDVTLVANDTGGAVAQLLASERPERLARLVLTPCDCFENFLPPAFRPIQWAARVPGLLTAAMQGMRLAALRRSPVGFGLLVRRPIPDEISADWMRPYLTQPEVRRDTIRFVRAIDARDTLAAAEQLASFDRPTLLAWAPEDLFFKLRYAQRLAAIIPGARLVQIPDSRTFVPEDQPERLADVIAQFVRESPPTQTPAPAPAAGSGATHRPG